MIDYPFPDWIRGALLELAREESQLTSESEVRQYGSTVFPGLLQTEAYARALTAEWAAGTQLERHVRFRLDRQRALLGEPSTQEGKPKHTFLLDEALLRRSIGGRQVMSDQLAHIEEVAKLPNVTIRVIPFGAGQYAGILGAPYMIAKVSHVRSWVYLEDGLVEDLCRFIPLPAEYDRGFEQACQAALPTSESIALIREAASSFATAA